MKIAVVAPEFPPEIGGTQRYAEGLVHALIQAGYTVTLFLRKDSDYDASKLPCEVNKILSINFKKDRSALKPYWGHFDGWHVCNASYSWIGLFVPTVITIFGNDIIAPYLFTQKIDLRNKSILKRGDRFSFWASKILTGRLQRKGLKHVKKVIAISQSTKDLALKKYPFLTGKIEIIPVGINSFSFQKAETIKGGEKHLLSVCRLDEPRKNIDSVIRALAELKNKTFQYTIVGEGHQQTVLEKLCGDLGIGGQVKFEGRVSDERLKKLYGSADLFVLVPTVEKHSVEGFGIVYLEANSYGVPVLAARAAGCLDAVAEGKSGYFVEVPDVENIKEALNQFISDQVRFKEEEIVSHANKFTWDVLIDQIKNIYTSIF